MLYFGSDMDALLGSDTAHPEVKALTLTIALTLTLTLTLTVTLTLTPRR